MAGAGLEALSCPGACISIAGLVILHAVGGMQVPAAGVRGHDGAAPRWRAWAAQAPVASIGGGVGSGG
jgi:hypothetical protein